MAKLFQRLSPTLRRRLMAFGIGAVICALVGGVALVQNHAGEESRARKDATALAFEKEPER